MLNQPTATNTRPFRFSSPDWIKRATKNTKKAFFGVGYHAKSYNLSFYSDDDDDEYHGKVEKKGMNG